MARITITRPNGETEYAELTTDKDLAGNDRLTVENAGTIYYAKLDREISTHMYIIQPDGRKLYVQKTLETLVTFDYTEDGEGDPTGLDFRLLKPRPQVINGVTLHSLQKAEVGEDTRIILYLKSRWTGTITVALKNMHAIFTYKDTYSSTCDVGDDGIDAITAYAKNTPFKVTIRPE